MIERADLRVLLEVIHFQADGCAKAGSRLYGTVLDGVAADLRAEGISAELLTGRGDDPFGSALALRLLGAVHRIVLEGRAPQLAAHYPSVGGDAERPGAVDAFLATLRAHREELSVRIDDGVQTNEVGRSAVLAGGYAEVARSTGMPLRVLEIGASAGLNLRFDHFRYEIDGRVSGDPDSPVRFEGLWQGPHRPDLPERFEVAERRGCDRNPIDATSDEGLTTLLAYTWPDQLERIARLRDAGRVAARVAATVERANAADWIAGALSAPVPGVATVVTHTIVLQYLSAADRQRVRSTIETAGRAADARAPLGWLRMEPAGDRAELRLTRWPGGIESVLATAGFHGQPIWWEP